MPLWETNDAEMEGYHRIIASTDTIHLLQARERGLQPMEPKIVKKMVNIPSPLLAFDIILIILSISENNIARFICFWLMASSVWEFFDDSYFK